MRITSLLGNSQRLDGGAMFGNVPRALWSRWAPPDEEHRIALACRTMLIQEDATDSRPGRTVLLETGIGAFFPPKLRDRFGVYEPSHVLLESLAAHGLSPSDVDVVVLSHLHFDHAGGLLTAFVPDAPLAIAFGRARVIVGRAAWERALRPHARDRASFIPELQTLLEQSGRLEIVDGEHSEVLGPGYSMRYSDGHTPGLMLTRVQSARGPITFMGDLIPGTPWVHLPVTMGYDRNPELLIDEKRAMLERVVAEGGWAFYTHDPKIAASRIAVDDQGRFSAVDGIESLAWTDA